MEIIRNLAEFSSAKPSFITIGTFDGVHIGHQQIIKRLVSEAAQNQCNSVLVTFFPHPRRVLQSETPLQLISTIDERIEVLEKMGLNTLVIQPFTEKFSRLSPAEFVRSILVEKLNIKKMFIGYDHRFGRNRSADINDLKSFGEVYDFEVVEISAQQIAEVAVSSTKIRKALEIGAIEKANTYLGNPFGLTGKVEKGKSLGRTIGFPTANIVVQEKNKLIPANGAYWVYATIDNKKVYGMMNIGFNPTFAGNERTIEVHFFNWSEELYGSLLTVKFLKRIRNEQKFDSVAALTDQLKKDQSLCENWMDTI